jgi:hypothetical protein
MDRSWQSDVEHVSLSTAAAVVYHQVMAKRPEVQSAEELNEILNRVAHAISNVASIYVHSGATPRQLIGPNFTSFTFERGATVLRDHKGIEHRGLSIRRGDMRAAVEIFRRAEISF